MSAKTSKSKDPLETVRVNISMTRGTSEVLKKVADHQHITQSAVITCLIRKKAEEVGLLPATAAAPLQSLPDIAQKKNGTN